jgi:CubicO group peptidase (beta-lactamase class C family)
MLTTIRALFALAFSAGLVLAQAGAAPVQAPAVPATAPGRVFSAWLQAFDSADRQQMQQFLQTYAPSKIDRLNDEMRTRRVSGELDLRKIESSSDTQLTALVQEQLSDSFIRITVTVDSAPPHYMTLMAFQPAERPAEFALPHLTQPQLVSSLGTRLRDAVADDRFSGTVLLAKDGKPVFEQAYGLADREHNVRNTLDTRFRLGSMNKMFTAVSIMQLVQAGKVDLDKPFGTYISDYSNKSVATSVTIRQLLTHTGGTGDFFGPEFDKNRLKLRTLQDYVDLFGNRPLRFEPGTKWEYSNYGFILLGVVIERVSGQNYYDYVRQHIYVPAGMKLTDSEPEDVAVPNRSVGYTRMNGQQWEPNTDTLPYRGTSAGGGYSTVGDLLSFANALQKHVLLNAQYTEMLTTGKVASFKGAQYGFGFEDSVINGTRCFGHGGGAPGMNGDLRICPSSGYVVAVLANMDPLAADRVTDFITNRLPQ